MKTKSPKLHKISCHPELDSGSSVKLSTHPPILDTILACHPKSLELTVDLHCKH